MGTFERFYNSLSEDINTRGKQFEIFVKWFLKNDPEWKSQVSEIWLWNEWPMRWGADCGIDIVFRHVNGDLWAVQAKCVAPGREISKSEIDSFISESADKRFQSRLLVSSTNGLGRNATQAIMRQEKPFVCFMLEHFWAARVDYPVNFDALLTGKAKPKETKKPHQLEAIKSAIAGFESNSRGQIIMACGSGKTLTSLWIAEELEARKTLFVVPSLSLLSQALREWAGNSSTGFNWICVCSDDSVTKSSDDDSWIHGNVDAGIPVTNNPAEINRFLNGDGARVVFSTYQSTPLIEAALSLTKLIEFDLIVADEAHRCAGKNSPTFSTVLYNEKIRSKKRLFMTATPRIVSNTHRSTAADMGIEISSMDDFEKFGPVFFRLSFSDAISNGLLSDYRVIVIGVNDEMIIDSIKNRELLRTDDDTVLNSEDLALHVALSKAIRKYNLKRIVTFHGRVKKALDFSEMHVKINRFLETEFKPSGKLLCNHVSGGMNSHRRNIILDSLRKLSDCDIMLLSNARCLSEGVDVPSLDAIAFIDPKSSHVEIVQALGRAIRRSENKDYGTILIPLYIEDRDDIDLAFSKSKYKPIWDVLNAMRSHDDRLAIELDNLRVELGQKPNSQIDFNIGNIFLDLPSSIDKSFVSGLEARLVSETSSSWMYWYGLLKAYVLRNNCTPPARYKNERGETLGAWVSRQRALKNNLTPEQIFNLEEIPEWTWNPREESWDYNFHYLKKYIKENLKLPSRGSEIDGIRIGSWVHTQRRSKQNRTLDEEKIEKIASIPEWNWHVFDEKWLNAYQSLKCYFKKNGNLNIPSGYVSDSGADINRWISTQRVQRFNRLDDEKRKLLEEIPGWTWSAKDEKWDSAFSKLKEYLILNNYSMPPKDYKTADGSNLHKWILRQRENKDLLDHDRYLKLDNLKGWSWGESYEEKWFFGYEELCNYVRLFGNSRPPTRYITENGFSLGSWVGIQRKNFDELDDKKKNLLLELPQWSSDLNRDLWIEAYLQLRSHLENNPEYPNNKFKTESGFGLGYWLYAQRTRFRNRLDHTQVQMLESLPNWTWDNREPGNNRNNRGQTAVSCK